MKRVLILCTGNSCRSQIAEGYIRKFGGRKVEVFSAGIETHGVNPMAIEVMREDGIDISHHTSNNVGEYKHEQFDYVLTVCGNANENCPVFPSQTKTIHYNFPDPAAVKGTHAEVMTAFRAVRDTIRKYSEEFVREIL